jgi:hypothetical protein
MSRPFQAFFLLFIHLVCMVFDPISPPCTRMLRHVRLEHGDIFLDMRGERMPLGCTMNATRFWPYTHLIHAATN